MKTSTEQWLTEAVAGPGVNHCAFLFRQANSKLRKMSCVPAPAMTACARIALSTLQLDGFMKLLLGGRSQHAHRLPVQQWVGNTKLEA